MTKKEMYAAIKEVVKDNEKMVAFIDHEIELLSRKKSSSKLTAKQEENLVIRQNLVNMLAEVGKPMTIKEIMAEELFSDLTCQRLSALLSQEPTITKTYEKKVPYFTIAVEEEEEEA